MKGNLEVLYKVANPLQHFQGISHTNRIVKDMGVRWMLSKDQSQFTYLMESAFWLEESVFRIPFLEGIDKEIEMESAKRNKVCEQNMFEDLDCKLYLHSELEIRELFQEILEITSLQSVDVQTMKNDLLHLSVLKNKWFDMKKQTGLLDEYVYYRYILELDCKDTSKQEQYVAFVATLLKALWNKGMKVVASSDFEEVLPFEGGYGYHSISGCFGSCA